MGKTVDDPWAATGAAVYNQPDLAMKIALVSAYDIAVPSGVNAHIGHLATEFRARGHEVRVFAPGPKRFETEAETSVIGRSIPIPSGGSLARITLSPAIGSKVRRALAEGEFDVVHLHEPLVPALTPVFLYYSKAINVGTFHAAHDGGSALYSLNRHLLRSWARRLHGRVVVSPAAARLVERYFPGHYDIVPNGVDVDRFQAEVPAPPDLLAARPYVLFVGRFEQRKGLPVLLQAFRMLKAQRPELSLVVVGDGARRKDYETWVQKQGLADVHFAGFVPGEALPAYYQHASVFCAPNTGNESFGIVLLEAMAAGAPVVASNIDGFASVITHGVDGLLVPPRDPEALAGALEEVIATPELHRALSVAGAYRAREFSWPQVAQRVLSYYERLIARHRGHDTDHHRRLR